MNTLNPGVQRASRVLLGWAKSAATAMIAVAFSSVWWFAILLLVFALSLAAGCSTQPTAEWERTYADGSSERVVVRASKGATEPATLAVTPVDITPPETPRLPDDRWMPGAAVTASTGAAQRVDQVGLAKAKGQTRVGFLLILIGIGTLIARAWFPVAPISASVVALGFGAAFVMAPPLPAVLFYGGPALFGIVFVLASGDNWVKLRRAIGASG